MQKICWSDVVRPENQIDPTAYRHSPDKEAYHQMKRVTA